MHPSRQVQATADPPGYYQPVMGSAKGQGCETVSVIYHSERSLLGASWRANAPKARAMLESGRQ